MQVAVIGLGAMGTALVRTLLRVGHRVAVWNRTSAKAAPLVREEAMFAVKKSIRIWNFFRSRVDAGQSRSTYC